MCISLIGDPAGSSNPFAIGSRGNNTLLVAKSLKYSEQAFPRQLCSFFFCSLIDQPALL